MFYTLDDGNAGIGIHWEGIPGASDVSERLPGEQTNNRAELYAVARAIELDLHPSRTLVIRLDSQYTIDALTTHFEMRIQKGWRGVLNKDLISFARQLIDSRPGPVKLEKVEAHSNLYNNELVDKLAKEGAALPVAEERDFREEYLHLKQEKVS